MYDYKYTCTNIDIVYWIVYRQHMHSISNIIYGQYIAIIQGNVNEILGILNRW
jgi:hypothetical protein